MTTDLSERYGAPSPARRRALLAGVAVVALVFGGWVAWTTFFHATPVVSSDIGGWDVADDGVDVTLSVSLEDDVTASCVLRAFAEDHSTVGELAFEPVDGTNTVTVRTERRATSVELLGCTAPGQPRPR